MARKEVKVLVHPFDSSIYESQPRFVRARDSILRRNSDLVILTHYPDLTKQRIGEREAEIFCTKEANPEPDIGWQAFSERLKPYKKVVFCGAELHFDSRGKMYTGCVLMAYEKTDVRRKRINHRACWRGERW